MKLHLFRDEDGQAMLEYSILSSMMVVATMVVYQSGWVFHMQENLRQTLVIIGLPFP